MITGLLPHLVLASTSSRDLATFSGVSFPAENAVITDRPSVSTTNSQAGIFDFSISPRTVKYVKEKLVVNSSGEPSVGLLTGYIPDFTCIGTCGSVNMF